MIIKKKYTINQNIQSEKTQEELEPTQESAVNIEQTENPLVEEVETKKESEAEQQENSSEEKKQTEKKKKKTADLDISLDDITFEQREERREGSRRRGYRRTQDRNIVSRAQKDAISIKEAAKNEGYNEGINQAQKDIEELKAQFKEFYNYKDEVFEKVSSCIMEISVEIAKKILNKEIQTDRAYLLPTIYGIVEELNKTENKIILKVMPKDVEIVKDNIPEIFSGSGFEAKISVIPDKNIKDGGVIVETSNGLIDASLETQISIIEQALKVKSVEKEES